MRILKELFSTVRLDLRALGYDGQECHHSAAFDGKKSLQELVLQRPLPECGSSSFGSAVLAELPDSVKNALSRFVEAAYVHPEVEGLTHVVSAVVDGKDPKLSSEIAQAHRSVEDRI